MRTFDRRALALLLAGAPLLLAWSSGYYGQPPPGVTRLALGAHWVCGWLIPLSAAAVLAYGTAARPVDPRVTAAAPRDPRERWWLEHGLTLASATVFSLALTLGQASRSAEPPLALLIPAVSGLVVAFCAAQIAVTRLRLSPGPAAFAALAVTALPVLAPCLTPALRWAAVDPTLAAWMALAPGTPPYPIGPGAVELGMVGPGAVGWPVLAVAAVVAARLLPPDVSAIPGGAHDLD
ncbi:hypothetical protein OIE66_12270 [Nonomuraea sp. NBC_01738]|uniref:hypothetical protein n=1 Tax=Nonomuraea sp. NBC_01738 TaxID=2976003 RepID=UPI002E1066BF|nr:hypothetical protein OIE66_12270 [Nonomuraea sp. NBC_01738]